MIAEIYKKANFEIEGKEDILTGNFFGAIGYTEHFGDMLGPMLRTVSFGAKSSEQFLNDLESVKDRQDYKIQFWKKFDWLNGKKEPDLFIEFEKFVLCIEVKYHSGLSGVDQLLTYAKVLKNCYPKDTSKDPPEGKRIWLVFLAKQPFAREIFESQEKAIEKIGIDGFGYLSWQSIHGVIRKLTPSPLYAKRIQKDLVEYLQAKKLNGFTRFPVEDYREFPDFGNIKEQLTSYNKQLHMIDLETSKNISNAFAAVHEVYDSVQTLLQKIDCNFEVYNRVEIEGSKNANNYMTWQSIQSTYGWLQTIFIKLYRNPDHPDKLFLVEIDLSSDLEAGPQMRFAVHQYKSMPTEFKVNDGWLYNQRRTKPEHFEIDIENACSIPKMDVIKRDKGFYSQVHGNFKKAWFSSCNLFEVEEARLENLIISQFNTLLERCKADETPVQRND